MYLVPNDLKHSFILGQENTPANIYGYTYTHIYVYKWYFSHSVLFIKYSTTGEVYSAIVRYFNYRKALVVAEKFGFKINFDEFNVYWQMNCLDISNETSKD